MPITINREAGDKAKGPRLQRLRCLLLCLDAIEKAANPKIYAAVEYKDDVYLKDVSNSKEYLEQNKNFDEDSSFTLNSNEIIKTVVGFCDMWVEYGIQSKEVYLGFYSTNKIGKENNTLFISQQGLRLPDRPILELLMLKEFDYPDFLPTAKELILQGYRAQYAPHKTNGNIKSLEAYTDENWKDFFKAIEWGFEELDEIETQKLVIDKIKNCKFFNHLCLDKEEIILSRLMDLLDEKQCTDDLLAKFVNSSDFELVFRKVASEGHAVLLADPVYKIWDSLPAPEDKRSILDKVNDVCKNIEGKTLQRLARKTTASRMLQNDVADPKSFMSLRYRIYEKCEEELSDYLNSTELDLSTTEAINKLFEHLLTQLKSYVGTLSTEFQYSLKNDTVIEGIILELFDSCYLSMDSK